MPQFREHPLHEPFQMNESLDRWYGEGGATAGFGSDALVAGMETLLNWERRILQCLGAAVVVEWNELPNDVKRNLFKLASAENSTDFANELPARLARFLHEHKDDLRD